ncbi:MAG: hypothetical protein ROZ09_03265 [Thiobacillus sp.]|jgi:hypothetical protein|uniref:hypothetical protein n=1 Tax=Thiobacillus sp. TaxID=924 RepID=UPI002893C998|nr:hypothetical protein [Thiobacillus sp.]MDT3705820.1 hypothetical protein [Thiobacillus sp.]
MRSMLPRRLLSWLFALTLLFGQAATFAHALGHLHGHDPALPDKVCEVCIAQAQLGSAVPPSLARLTIPAAGCIIASSAAHVCVDLAPRPARARAPPAPSDL